MKLLADKALNAFQLSQLESLHAANNKENVFNFVLPFQNFSPIEFQFLKSIIQIRIPKMGLTLLTYIQNMIY